MRLTLLAAYLFIVITMVAGWIMNISAIIHATAWTPLLVLRIFGVFMGPFGALLGLFF